MPELRGLLKEVEAKSTFRQHQLVRVLGLKLLPEDLPPRFEDLDERSELLLRSCSTMASAQGSFSLLHLSRAIGLFDAALDNYIAGTFDPSL